MVTVLRYDVIFVDNINVLDLALWADKILKLNVFLCNLEQEAQLSQRDHARFMSLNILLSNSSSLKVIRNDTVDRACVSPY